MFVPFGDRLIPENFSGVKPATGLSGSNGVPSKATTKFPLILARLVRHSCCVSCGKFPLMALMCIRPPVRLPCCGWLGEVFLWNGSLLSDTIAWRTVRCCASRTEVVKFDSPLWRSRPPTLGPVRVCVCVLALAFMSQCALTLSCVIDVWFWIPKIPLFYGSNSMNFLTKWSILSLRLVRTLKRPLSESSRW